MSGEKLHILLVDDEQDILDFMARVLRSSYRTSQCSSASDALALLEANHYDMLISDLKMPSMTGLELLARATKIRPEIVRIILSGFTVQQQMEQALKSGQLHNYITKPTDRVTVLEAIEVAQARAASLAASPLS